MATSTSIENKSLHAPRPVQGPGTEICRKQLRFCLGPLATRLSVSEWAYLWLHFTLPCTLPQLFVSCAVTSTLVLEHWGGPDLGKLKVGLKSKEMDAFV